MKIKPKLLCLVCCHCVGLAVHKKNILGRGDKKSIYFKALQFLHYSLKDGAKFIKIYDNSSWLIRLSIRGELVTPSGETVECMLMYVTCELQNFIE